MEANTARLFEYTISCQHGIVLFGGNGRITERSFCVGPSRCDIGLRLPTLVVDSLIVLTDRPMMVRIRGPRHYAEVQTRGEVTLDLGGDAVITTYTGNQISLVLPDDGPRFSSLTRSPTASPSQ